jgi:RNA polymerase sigma factor (sigma-70 family)
VCAGETSGQHANSNAAQFTTTDWSIVLAAGQNLSPESDAALARLCETYWYPLYHYVRRQGNGPEDAEDLTQQFFARLLEKNYLAKADRDRGKFRTFLLGSMKNFLVDEWKRAGRLKRGGGHSFISFDFCKAESRYAAEPISESENGYEKQYAVAMVEQVIRALEHEYAAVGKGPLLAELKGCIWGEESSASYAEIGRRLNMAEGTVKVSAHRLRQRFGELLRGEVAHTVMLSQEVDDELRHLIAVLS